MSRTAIFSEILQRSELNLQFKMESGDLFIVDNRRVLHGRTGFAGSGGRHLQGCYADRDALLSTWENSSPRATMKPTRENIVDFIRWLFDKRGADVYLGEAVTMAEHMLQAAHFAESDGADETLIVAALLHDVGHFTGEFGDDYIERGVDNLHEDAGRRGIVAVFSLRRSPSRFACMSPPKNICALQIRRIMTLCRNRPSAPWNCKAER